MATEERCEQSDLPATMCAHCRPEPVASVASEGPSYFASLLAKSQVGRWFYADYPGHCSVCGEEFEPDDKIRADGSGGWQGRDCCGDDD